MDPVSPREAASPSPADQLTIDTPEQTVLEFAVAGIGSRFLALAIDTLIQTSSAGLIGLAALGAYFFLHLPRASGPWLGAFAILAFFLTYYGYFVLFESIWNGQTPGKRIIRIRVIKDDGRPMLAIESVGRNLMRIVDQMPFLYAIGIVSVLLSKKSKRLGDFVAGTIVVHEKALDEIKPIWEATRTSNGLKLGAEHLTLEELALVEAFLNRRNALEPHIRYETSARILDRLKPKLQIPEGVPLRNEELLEAIAAERRASAQYS